MCSASGAALMRRGPVWECEGRDHIIGTRSKRSPCAWFSRPRLTDVAPYLSVDLLTPSDSLTSAFASGGDGSPAWGRVPLYSPDRKAERPIAHPAGFRGIGVGEVKLLFGILSGSCRSRGHLFLSLAARLSFLSGPARVLAATLAARPGVPLTGGRRGTPRLPYSCAPMARLASLGMPRGQS